MTKVDAVLTLLRDSRMERSSAASYRKALRACKALDLNESETNVVMQFLEYHASDGVPYHWLETKKEAK